MERKERKRRKRKIWPLTGVFLFKSSYALLIILYFLYAPDWSLGFWSRKGQKKWLLPQSSRWFTLRSCNSSIIQYLPPMYFLKVPLLLVTLDTSFLYNSTVTQSLYLWIFLCRTLLCDFEVFILLMSRNPSWLPVVSPFFPQPFLHNPPDPALMTYLSSKPYLLWHFLKVILLFYMYKEQ